MAFLVARATAVGCWVRGHAVLWRTQADVLCAGDIVCVTCNVVHWCRAHDPQWMRAWASSR
jgi:quercetin dioxygenase-like cupin family protein